MGGTALKACKRYIALLLLIMVGSILHDQSMRQKRCCYDARRGRLTRPALPPVGDGTSPWARVWAHAQRTKDSRCADSLS